jgi:hypothetical protein
VGYLGLKLEIDKQKCLEVSLKLIERFSENKDYYLQKVPELRFSKGIEHGLEHRLFLFFTIAQDSMRQSNELYEKGRYLAIQQGFSYLMERNIDEVK